MYFPRLRHLREDHDLTQEEVAKILHCQRSVYQNDMRVGKERFPYHM